MGFWGFDYYFHLTIISCRYHYQIQSKNLRTRVATVSLAAVET
jgi:hypothetical protein